MPQIEPGPLLAADPRSRPTTSTNLGLGLRTTNAGTLTDALTLAPNGDAGLARDLTVTGNINAGFVSQFRDTNISGNSYGEYGIGCPAGTYLLSGGGGHRDYNNAQADVTLNYSGPNSANPNEWLIRVTNTSGSSRAIRIYCNCARLR